MHPDLALVGLGAGEIILLLVPGLGAVALIVAEASDFTLTATGMTLGTPRSMAPGQFERPAQPIHEIRRNENPQDCGRPRPVRSPCLTRPSTPCFDRAIRSRAMLARLAFPAPALFAALVSLAASPAPDGNGSFVTSSDSREGLIGCWTKNFPVTGGAHHRFEAWHRRRGRSGPQQAPALAKPRRLQGGDVATPAGGGG